MSVAKQSSFPKIRVDIYTNSDVIINTVVCDLIIPVLLRPQNILKVALSHLQRRKLLIYAQISFKKMNKINGMPESCFQLIFTYV